MAFPGAFDNIDGSGEGSAMLGPSIDNSETLLIDGVNCTDAEVRIGGLSERALFVISDRAECDDRGRRDPEAVSERDCPGGSQSLRWSRN
jgi:hypothetical protein